VPRLDAVAAAVSAVRRAFALRGVDEPMAAPAGEFATDCVDHPATAPAERATKPRTRTAEVAGLVFKVDAKVDGPEATRHGINARAKGPNVRLARLFPHVQTWIAVDRFVRHHASPNAPNAPPSPPAMRN